MGDIMIKKGTWKSVKDIMNKQGDISKAAIAFLKNFGMRWNFDGSRFEFMFAGGAA